jgi:hypothetical protein
MKHIMPVRYRRAAFAAVLIAAAVVVPAAAFASGPGSPAAKPAPSATTLKTKSPAGVSNTAGTSVVSHATAQRIVFAVFGKDGAGARDKIKKSGPER